MSATASRETVVGSGCLSLGRPAAAVLVASAITILGGEMTAHEILANYEHEAAFKVMRDEAAWFQTLADETVGRIFCTAPRDAPEYEYARTELTRRAAIRGGGYSSRVPGL